MHRKYLIHFIAILAVLGLVVAPAQADHSWSTYHWARTTSSFDLTIINSTTADWDGYVSQAIGDWSQSQVLNMVEDTSGATSRQVRRKCDGGDGTVRICNLDYGNTGWLGIAGISIDNQGHITTGYTKLNDTYYSSGSYYDTPEWRLSVTCQELGHNVGLGHQDEDFDNTSLKSCMDYQDPPWEFPNQHDYEQLEIMYGHTDSYDSYATSGGGDDGGGGNGCNAPPGKGCNKAAANSQADIGWGRSIAKRGNQEMFIQIHADGSMEITHVLWADSHAMEDHEH